jgi:hypothetical protein
MTTMDAHRNAPDALDRSPETLNVLGTQPPGFLIEPARLRNF